jgi:hypothetical protein
MIEYSVFHIITIAVSPIFDAHLDGWFGGGRSEISAPAMCLLESVAHLGPTRRLHVTTLDETTLA